MTDGASLILCDRPAPTESVYARNAAPACTTFSNLYQLQGVPAPPTGDTCTVHLTNLRHTNDRPAPYIWEPGAIITHTVHLTDLRHTNDKPAPYIWESGAWRVASVPKLGPEGLFSRYFRYSRPTFGDGGHGV